MRSNWVDEPGPRGPEMGRVTETGPFFMMDAPGFLTENGTATYRKVLVHVAPIFHVEGP